MGTQAVYENRPFGHRAFADALPKRIASTMFNEAAGTLKEQGIARKRVRLVYWKTDNGITKLSVRHESKGHPVVWESHWPPGDTSLTPVVVELFAAQESGLHRGLHESGDAYATRVYAALKRKRT